ncbi:MAG: TetR/AcrR family transcriptional regulator [Pseudonocardiales bacterium]|jgi:AcrR family transcriptional regulator|nr:TetR/AcrR family transcriptional regulator [Pseudonocardiales bacterium]
MTAGSETSSRVAARERILATAYELFTRRGIRSVGVNEIIASSGVAKASFYRNFRSKDDLVLAVLARREQNWTKGLVDAGARRLGDTAQERLLAIFDVFDEWFACRDDFEACSFINVLLEMGAVHPLGRASIDYLANIRRMVRDWAEEAQLREPDEFAHCWHILMKGSIIAAAEGDTNAARRAKRMAASLIRNHSG